MTENPPPAAPRGRPGPPSWLAPTIKIVVPVAVLGGAVWLAAYWLGTPPQAKRQPPERQPRLVEAAQAAPGARSVTIEVMGSVRPAQRAEIDPQVSGRIVWIDPGLAPGAEYEAGAPLMQIEKRDFEIAVAQRRSDVQSAENAVTMAQRALVLAEASLRLEMGNQAVARREYELLRDGVDEQSRPLVLREPQLKTAEAEVKAAGAEIASAEAALEAAKLALEDAKLDLERSTVKAPFDAVVEEKLASVGDTVTSTTPLVHVVGSDEFWVELRVPEGDLRWIDLPSGDQPGSEVKFYNTSAWGPDVCRYGRVLRRLPSVDAQGRMARLLAVIEDPLALKPENAGSPSLLVGAYVRAEVVGKSFDDVYAIPRAWLHDGDTVRIMADDNTLAIREVDVLYRGRDEVLIDGGLTAGEWIITTNLSAPVNGMPVRAEAPAAASEPRAMPAAAERAEAEPRS